jgi:hypothetical protein
LRDLADGVVDVLPEGVVDVGGEAGIVDGLLLVDDRGVPVPLQFFVLPLAALFVGLPLLLLRVANPH